MPTIASERDESSEVLGPGRLPPAAGRWLRQSWPWLVAALLVLVALVWILARWERQAAAARVPPAEVFPLDAYKSVPWEQMGGKWTITGGVVHNSSGERGAKLLMGSKSWRNYTLRADLRTDGDHGDFGLVIRSTYERPGLDTYSGYYVGLRSTDGTMLVGRSAYAWMEARPVPIPGGVTPHVWYRMQVTAYGCDLAASVQNLDSGQTAWVVFEDKYCLESGRFALRSVDSGGWWRNISIAPATRADYLALAQHADQVERPVVPEGPPWLTPWRAGLLFAGALALGVLGQRTYQRMQQWKLDAIDEERERLAHAIHDTMAQSFAGVGYQIQGIRNSVMKSDRDDAGALADQLGVAYQLVRRCHEDASRTIRMLGSSAAPGPGELLRELAATARKIAGERIKVTTELRGAAGEVTLDLRIADALLQIGREAISNAISHGFPQALAITLSLAGREVVLEVSDDGCGFDARPERSGFGIMGMEKRAREVAGMLTIQSAPGEGAAVRVQARLRRGRRWWSRGAA